MMPKSPCADLANLAFIRLRGICEIFSSLLKAHIPISLSSAMSRLTVLAYKILIAATRLHSAPKGVKHVFLRSFTLSDCAEIVRATL